MRLSPKEAQRNDASLSLPPSLASPAELEPIFDDLTALAAQICQAPIALIALMEKNELIIKASVGLETTTVLGVEVFHAHTMLLQPSSVLTIEDTLADARFANTPLVTSTPPIQFYAGTLLVAADGSIRGLLCVMDHAPRQLYPEHSAALTRLARCIVNQLTVHQQRTRDQQEIIQALLNALPDSALLLTSEGKTLATNEIAAQRLGMRPEELVGQSPEKFLPSALAASRKAKLEEAVRTEQLVIFQDERDGQLYETRVCPIADFSGQVHRLAVFARDITAQQQFEQKLRETAARLSLVFNNTSDMQGLLRVEPDGRLLCVAVNRSFLSTFQLQHPNLVEEDVVGKDRVVFLASLGYSPEMIDFEAPRFREALERHVPVRYDTTLPSPLGNFSIAVTIIPFIDDNTHYTYLLWNGQNITERKRVEKALRKSEERYALVVQGASDGLWDWDLLTDTIYFSPRWKEIIGYQDDELPNKAASTFFNHIHPNDKTLIDETIPRLLEATKPFRVEFRLRHKDGGYRWMLSRGQVVRNTQGRPVRMVGSITDITERKQAERQIKSALEEKEILLKEIHHRVKNNLQIVSSLLYLQARKTDNQTLQAILQESRNRIISMSLIHQKLYQSTDLAHIKFADYARDLTLTLFRTYGVSPAKVELSVEGNGLTLDIDRAVPCGLIINEVVSNALKYAFPQGQRGTVHIELQQDQTQQHHLLLSDNGVGLPQDFDLRSRSSLGMTLIERLTEQLQGTMEQRSSIQGTTYHITFPKNL